MKKRATDAPKIALTKEQTELAVNLLKDYISGNFDVEIGSLRGGFLLEFITENIGAFYYNKGIEDAMAFVAEKAEEMYLLMKDERE